MGKIQAVETGLSTLWRSSHGKINPKTLGWVRPDGVINFQTAEVAETYAKNRCLSALHTAKPFERGVLVKDDQVLAEVNGDFTQIVMSPCSDKMVGADFYHGHPKLEGHFFPVSLEDYLVMISQRLKKIVALNEKGEYSTLMQNSFEQIGMGSVATSEYAKEFVKIFPKEVQKKAEQIIHFKIGFPYGNSSQIADFEKSGLTLNEINTINTVETKAKQDGTLAKIIHDFWGKVAKKLGCIYKTNYSSL